MSYKGLFKPKHFEKYKGNPKTIVWRSKWELKLMIWLDNSPEVIEWSSEELRIPYISPKDSRIHQYFPDFWLTKKDKNGKINTFIIEVKPAKQTRPPKIQTKQTRKYLTEVVLWGVNQAKFKAATEYCNKREWKFIIITENELFGNK